MNNGITLLHLFSIRLYDGLYAYRVISILKMDVSKMHNNRNILVFIETGK